MILACLRPVSLVQDLGPHSLAQEHLPVLFQSPEQGLGEEQGSPLPTLGSGLSGREKGI